MPVTPEEAQTMVCPMRLTSNALNTYDARSIQTHCIGGLCMVWRWKNAQYEEGWCGLADKDKVDPPPTSG